ncbi:MAG TPA: replicative DNA helicase [Gammaproteobacteria bacterium]|nr:replicative DNA helicase [Gammaproteobacteria bacterium]
MTQEQQVRQPPHSIEAEQAVLGGLMINNQAWDQIADRIQEHDFYQNEHQVIFRAMQALTSANKPFDIVTIPTWLEEKQWLEKAGGWEYLKELAENTATAANVVVYADIIRERSILRQLLRVGLEIQETASKPEGRTSSEILDEAEQKVFNIAEKRSRNDGPENIKTIAARALTNIEIRKNNPDSLNGLPSGFKDLDKLTNGLQKGDLVIIAGRPSMGKTILGINIAEHVAIKSKKAVLVFSMEMPSESLANRMLASLGRIDLSRLHNGKLKDDEWNRLATGVQWLDQANMFIDESPALSPIEVRARARRLVRDGHTLGLIVIDYLQLMRCGWHAENRTAEISEISRSLKALAKELNVPVIALSQLNRSLEQRPNKRPVMSDLRESGAIEQDADLIVFIYRDEVYNEESPDKGSAEILIAKHRNGPIGMVRLTFMGHYAKFENYLSSQAVIMPQGVTTSVIE